MILTGDGIDVLLAQALAAPSGNEDQSWHMGRVLTWDDISGVNTVQVNGTVIPNMKSIVGGVGASYKPGDNVMVQRKQTQYVIHGRLQSPGVSSGSTPKYSVGTGGNISGAVGSWRDLNAGPSAVPSITLRVGTNQNFFVSFGAESMDTNGSSLVTSPSITGDFTMPPGTFAGQTCFVSSGAVAVSHSPGKTVGFFAGSGIAPYFVTPGVITITLKFILTLSTGSVVGVTRPWLSVIPF